MLRRSLDDAVRRGLLVANPAASRPRPTAAAASAAAASPRPGTPTNSEHSSTTPPGTGCTPPCGPQPTPGCAAASSPASTGGTSTSTTAGCPSTDPSSRSATNSTSHGARPEPRGAASTSTPPPSRSCGTGDRNALTEDPGFDPEDPDAYVFARPDGTRVHPQLISDAFKRKVRTSGLPRVRLHDLRHTHATLLLKAGVPIKVVVGTSRSLFARRSRWRPTSTSCPACNGKPPRPSPACSSFYRIPPGRSLGRSSPTGPSALGKSRRPRSLTWAFFIVVGGGGRI